MIVTRPFIKPDPELTETSARNVDIGFIAGTVAHVQGFVSRSFQPALELLPVPFFRRLADLMA